MSLKDLTWEHHKDAERQEFVKVMMSGKINPELYATYLWNQHKKYDLLVMGHHNGNKYSATALTVGYPSAITAQVIIKKLKF